MLLLHQLIHRLLKGADWRRGEGDRSRTSPLLPRISHASRVFLWGGRRPSNFLSWISNEREFAPLSSHQRRDGRVKRSGREGGGDGEVEGRSLEGVAAMELDRERERERERAKSRAPEFRAPFFDTTRSSGYVLFSTPSLVRPPLFFSTTKARRRRRRRIENAFQFGRRDRWSTVFIGAPILIHADSGRRRSFLSSPGGMKGARAFPGWRFYIYTPSRCRRVAEKVWNGAKDDRGGGLISWTLDEEKDVIKNKG